MRRGEVDEITKLDRPTLIDFRQERLTQEIDTRDWVEIRHWHVKHRNINCGPRSCVCPTLHPSFASKLRAW